MWNNISGSIPKEIGSITSLELLLLDGNQLTGPLPEELGYLPNMDRTQIDENHISGPLPKSFANLNKTKHFHMNNNSISGQIPPELSRLPSLVHLQLDNNNFNGTTIPANYSKMPKLLKFLKGNPLCWDSNLAQFCESVCPAQACPPPYEYSPTSPVACFCARPLFVGYRLKSPGFSDFRPYRHEFEVFLTSRLELSLYQLYIDSFTWKEGPRLLMHLKFFPVYDAENNTHGANSPSSGLSKGTLAGLVLGTIAVAVTLFAVVTLLIMRRHVGKYYTVSRRRRCEYLMFVKLGFSASTCSRKIVGLKDFTYREIAVATNNFEKSTQVGEGGYGKVYKGILADGTVVAIKHAQEGSLQGVKEFLTEIEFLSRLHHRNLVSLIGYCDEEAKCNEPLSFAMRLRIVLGSAKSILYLHIEANPPIFHRDIKASNILLDSKHMAKVADFGLSRLAPLLDIEGIVPAYVSTVVKGTPVNVACKYGMIFSIIDGQMRSYPSKCVVKFLNLALKCCEDETDARPSMAEVVRELESIWHMMTDSDNVLANPMDTDVEKVVTTPSSSSTVKDPYVSFEISSIELVSEAVPSITPR
ncbi:hypothetical protein CMV_000742 [Castanea mollissima]|uniref:Protein kinase domain-containing protein n=1 Tax=Castanea mollissima TaxID=60419 RepID=A0A8J4VYU4_9ROSI|nr:hypothetical protein CMV_000742 [Castanea mollissima]